MTPKFDSNIFQYKVELDDTALEITLSPELEMKEYGKKSNFMSPKIYINGKFVIFYQLNETTIECLSRQITLYLLFLFCMQVNS